MKILKFSTHQNNEKNENVRLSLSIAICGITTNVTNLNMKIILK
jgi:hypothetical protein